MIVCIKQQNQTGIFFFPSWYSLKSALSSGRSLELLGDGCNVLALVKRLLQLQLRWLPRPISRKCSSSIRATSFHILHLEHSSTKCVTDGDKHHPMVNQLSYRRQSTDHHKKKNIFKIYIGKRWMKWSGLLFWWENKLTRWFPGHHLESQCCRRYQLVYRRATESSRVHR